MRIQVDGRDVGERLLMYLFFLENERFRLLTNVSRLERRRYKSKKGRVKKVALKTKQVKADCILYGSVTITGLPPETAVRLDGNPIVITEGVPFEVPAGRSHRFEFDAKFGATVFEDVRLNAQERKTLLPS